MGTLMTNVLICLVGCFGKVGYFPSLLITMLVLYCSSYLLIMYDQIIKRGYLFCFLVINGIAISPNLIDYYAILLNFIVINIFIKFIFTIKHLISISSISLFILTYVTVSIEGGLFAIFFLFIYFVWLLLFYVLLLLSSSKKYIVVQYMI